MKQVVLMDKLGAAGSLLAAAAAPCCYPLLAPVGAALGLGALEPWRGYVDHLIQGFVALAVIGAVVRFRRDRRGLPLGVSLLSATAIFFAYHVIYHVALIYLGLAGLALVAVWDFTTRRQRNSCCRRIELNSLITCPHCGYQKQEVMPTDACQVVYECQKCRATLRPKKGDCCVFCSYGSVKCPPIQLHGGACV